MIDIDNFGSHWGLLYWLTGQPSMWGGYRPGTLGSSGSGKKGMRSATFFSGIRCIQIEHPLNGWKNWMNLFHRQNKSYLSVFPQCALTCALMSAAIKGGPLIRSIHERMFYAKEQILAILTYGRAAFWDWISITPRLGKIQIRKCPADPNQCKLCIWWHASTFCGGRDKWEK